MKKAKGVHVYKCLYPNCQNFFTSTSNKSVKYCQNHTRFPTTNHPRFLLLASVLVLLFVGSQAAQAVSLGTITVGPPTIENNKGYAVGVFLSDSCVRLVKVGSNVCPGYDILVPIFDNSILKYSGSFSYVNGFYQRTATPYKNSMGYYQHDYTFRILVDAPKTAKLPIVIIEPKLPEYFATGQFVINEVKDSALKDSKATMTQRSVSHTRYVNDDCTYAVIGAVNWKAVLTDTLNFMKNNCNPSETSLKTITEILKPVTNHPINSTYKYQLEQWNKEIAAKCLTTYGSCKDLKQPR